MSVLILKNTPTEGPGSIGAFLAARGIACREIDLAHQGLEDSSAHDTLVMMGGPMSVNDEAQYPYLTAEMKLAEQFMKEGKRVFGVCLGAQLMAKALGAQVYRGPEKEIGWYTIDLKDAGLTDPLMARLAPSGGSFPVFHWHGETFDIPAGGERLASSELYPNQAFRYGPRAYAFQFHIEVSEGMIIDWLRDEPVDLEAVRKDTELYYPAYAERAESFYEAFFEPRR